MKLFFAVFPLLLVIKNRKGSLDESVLGFFHEHDVTKGRVGYNSGTVVRRAWVFRCRCFQQEKEDCGFLCGLPRSLFMKGIVFKGLFFLR